MRGRPRGGVNIRIIRDVIFLFIPAGHTIREKDDPGSPREGPRRGPGRILLTGEDDNGGKVGGEARQEAAELSIHLIGGKLHRARRGRAGEAGGREGAAGRRARLNEVDPLADMEGAGRGKAPGAHPFGTPRRPQQHLRRVEDDSVGTRCAPDRHL